MKGTTLPGEPGLLLAGGGATLADLFLPAPADPSRPEPRRLLSGAARSAPVAPATGPGGRRPPGPNTPTGGAGSLAGFSAQSGGWHHGQLDGHSGQPARLSSVVQPEARLRFSFVETGGVFQFEHGSLVRVRHRQQASARTAVVLPIKPGDLLLADRGFATYLVLALLEKRGVACLFWLHKARSADLRQGLRLGRHDRLFVWSILPQKPR